MHKIHKVIVLRCVILRNYYSYLYCVSDIKKTIAVGLFESAGTMFLEQPHHGIGMSFLFTIEWHSETNNTTAIGSDLVEKLTCL